MTDQNNEPFAVILALDIFSLHDDISNLFFVWPKFSPKRPIKSFNLKNEMFFGGSITRSQRKNNKISQNFNIWF